MSTSVIGITARKRMTWGIRGLSARRGGRWIVGEESSGRLSFNMSGLLCFKNQNASPKFCEIGKGGLLCKGCAEHHIIMAKTMKSCKNQIISGNRFVKGRQIVGNAFSLLKIINGGLRALLQFKQLEFET